MEVLTIDEIPTITSLYQRERLSHPAGHKPLHAPSAAFNKRISLVKYDITRLQLDAVVNAANESLLGGGGVDGAIHRAAGPRLFDECSRLDGCDTGSAKITNGYKLPARKVIHAVGPVYSQERRRGVNAGEGPGRSERLLRSCYRRSLDLCDQNGLETVAFSCLSTGIYGYPSTEAAQAALSEVRTYFEEGKGPNIKSVVFCVFLPKDNEAYAKYIPAYFPHEDFKGEVEDTPAASASTLGVIDAKTKTQEEKKHEEWPESGAKVVHRPIDTIASSSDVQSPKKIKLSTAAAREDLSASKEEDDVVNVSEPPSAVSGTSDGWVEVDKSSIPQKATVEDAEEE